MKEKSPILAQRVSLSKTWENPTLPPLSAIQTDSFQRFLSEGIFEVLEEINPIRDYTGRGWELWFSNPRFEEPKVSQEEARKKGLTFSVPWYLTATLKDIKSGKEHTQEIYMGELPVMTEGGIFIINGVERAVVNQLLRSEGVYFEGTSDPISRQPLTSARVLPKNGAWLELSTARKNFITVKISNYRKLAATTLLRIFGLVSDNEIRQAFADIDTDPNRPFIEETLKKDPSKNRDEAYLEVFEKIRPGEPPVLENAKITIEHLFFDPRRYDLGKAGRFKLNRELGLEFALERRYRLLQKEDLVAAVRKIIELNHGIGSYSDVDHLGNRRVRTVGELVASQLRIGFLQLEKVVKERISLYPRDSLPKPALVISTRPIEARLHSFFASSQLSQYHEQTNPLAGLEHLRRLSVKGPGGLTAERAGFSVRDAHFTHYGRICPIKTPEGNSIGLTTHLTLYAKVNELGFLEAPYRRLKKQNGKVYVTSETVYLAAYDEDLYTITDASVRIGGDGQILDKRVPLRRKGEFYLGDVQSADYIDLTPVQIVSASAGLIPFLANDDVTRALMASNMENQAVPLTTCEVPIVGTGIEKEIAKNSGVLVLSEGEGRVEDADAQKISIREKDGKLKTYPLSKFVKSNDETCYNQKPLVEIGQKVKEGDILADGPCTKEGELALGKNLTVAYMHWEGYGYEDALIISERLRRQDVLSSIHISEHTVRVLETKLGPEEVTRDIPNVSEESLKNLDEEGIVVIGAQVKSGDILVGKIAPKGETELSAEERLLRAIFGEKAREVRDVSLRMPHGEYGTVIGVKILNREETELPSGVLEEISVRVAQLRKIMVGDKLAGRHGNKGVISILVPEEDMPYLSDGTPVDIIMSPGSIIKRMNLGQILETHLGWAGKSSGKNFAIPVFEKFSSGFLGEELKKAGLPISGKVRLCDGKTGIPFDQEIVVGEAYIMKLEHLAEDKMHARSTGPYALITQQPLGGKAQFGGQRFGEMEVWSLEAYGAAYALQEMLTIKSDDVAGRAQAYRAIIQGEPVPAPTVPESFKLLVRELNGVGLNVETLGKIRPVSEVEVPLGGKVSAEEEKAASRVYEEEKDAGEIIKTQNV